MDYRVEDKYIITEDKWAFIENRLAEICSPDIHGHKGTYTVRSVYFDDMYDSCLSENESGTDAREKFRIRTYDMGEDVIQLELKSKLKGFTRKKSVSLSREEAERLLMRDDDLYLTRDTALITKLCSEMKYRRLQPVILIEYERKAYTYPVGNVRITFDKNIGAGTDIMSLWSDPGQMTPIMPTGRHILEIKYDEFLPDHIRSVLDVGSLQRISYSKYYYSRVMDHI